MTRTETEYFQFTLSNGIRLIHLEVPNEVAHCGVVVNTGSRDELEAEEGLAHFIEHVIFKGTKRRKAYHILSRLEDVGGELNAFTTKEETFIYGSFLHEFYDRALELFADIIFNSQFPEKEIRKEKDVIIDEINSYKDTPSELIYDDFEEMVFEGHPLGRNILGTPEKVRSFTRQNILSFIDRNYCTDQMVICSVGKLKSSRFLKLCEKYFGEFPEKTDSTERGHFNAYQPQQRKLSKGTFQSHFMYGNIAYSFNHPNRVALKLLTNWLGGPGMNARLNLSIREKHGIAYNIEANYTYYSDTGLFNIYLGTDRELLDKSIRLVNSELKKLREKKLGSMQLKKAKYQLMGQVAIGRESNLARMLSIGKSLVSTGKVKTLKQVYEAIEEVSAEQLLEVANEVLNQERLSVLIYENS